MNINTTTVKVKLRKSEHKERWGLYLESHPATDVQSSQRVRKSINRFVSTPIFICGLAKRDKNGVIQCTSPIDQESCLFAEEMRRKLQAEYDRLALMTDEEKELAQLAEVSDADFLDYMDYLTNERHRSSSKTIRINWKRARQLLCLYAKSEVLPLKKLDVKFMTGFREFLLTAPRGGKKKGHLSRNSAATYFSIVKAAIRQAFREGYLPTDLAAKLTGIPEEDSMREFLTIEELNKLADTPCEMPVLKAASLFSALTGLRHSDLMKLTWKEIEDSEGKSILCFKQQKTKGLVRMPISSQARQLCGERREANTRVFEDLTPPSWISRPLGRWIAAAGIKKHITFHCFRHTFATLQIAAGTDIFTVSKMLGHTNVRTTQIYAKLVDEKKELAAQAIIINNLTNTKNYEQGSKN